MYKYIDADRMRIHIHRHQHHCMRIYTHQHHHILKHVHRYSIHTTCILLHITYTHAYKQFNTHTPTTNHIRACIHRYIYTFMSRTHAYHVYTDIQVPPSCIFVRKRRPWVLLEWEPETAVSILSSARHSPTPSARPTCFSSPSSSLNRKEGRKKKKGTKVFPWSSP